MSPVESLNHAMTQPRANPPVDSDALRAQRQVSGNSPEPEASPLPLEVRDLTVSYDRKAVLWNVNLDVAAGRIVGIVGPNGAGKTTLIKAIMGLLPRQAGTVRINGGPLKKQPGAIGYVPQRETVDWDFPVTVYDVVMMGTYGRLGLFRRPGRKERELCERCLQQVQMLPFAHRQIANLSGGQQQRVFLARALAQEAMIYLMDEPFAGVDAVTESAIIDLLRKLRDDGRTILVIHHDLQTAADYFDEILLLNRRVVAYGPTKDVFTTENLRATYGGRLAVMPDTVGGET
ncbi:High-affinity zinc uptake system ATP-binding protein ZnuC [Symmachiella dynata]|uniref:High-affinity zinc uptake system ATP-binding protein ZnuC n=2 Tax=Symmachiella dynata TaxID=2527995 RepID=A0A517ZIB2_9PLAN|nr:High-affinity zinc uptake system ATP-binding protein ZnuC [Symmachiella dynata]